MMNNFAMEMAESHFITACNEGVTYDLLYQQTHLLCEPLILQDSKGVLREIYFVNYIIYPRIIILAILCIRART